MNPYLRNFIILILIGTINFFIFMFISGRTALFLGRSPTAEKSVGSNGPSSLQKNSLISEVIRRGGHGSLPPSVKKPQGNISEPMESFIFNNLSNKSGIHITEYQKSHKSDLNKTSSPALLQGNATLQGTHRPNDNLLMLYNRDDSSHVNPHGYHLILDEPHACFDESGSPKDVFLLVLISTIHKNFEQRRAIRETWGSPREVMGRKIITLFLLAYNEDAQLQRQVEDECNEHHDLLQEDFLDTYKNLTLKTIMGMKWASSHCPHAFYVMKTDDDMYVSYSNLVQHLSSSNTPSTNYAAGFLINGGPIRDRKSKWYMPKEIYPETRYPPFLSGTGYVMSSDLTGKIYEKSLDTKYLHLEDVFVAVCLKALNVKPVKQKEFNNWRTPYSYCRYRRLITTHMVPPSEMHRIWNDQQRKHSIKC